MVGVPLAVMLRADVTRAGESSALLDLGTTTLRGTVVAEAHLGAPADPLRFEVGAGPGVAVAFTDRRQPVCAAWRPALSAVVDEAVQRGERRIWKVLETLSVVEVELDPRVLANMNTPSDLND